MKYVFVNHNIKKTTFTLFILMNLVVFTGTLYSTNIFVYAEEFDFTFGYSEDNNYEGITHGRNRGLVVDSEDNVYVASVNPYGINKFDSKGEFLKFWGGPGNTNGKFYYPSDLATDPKGNVYTVATNGLIPIQVFDNNGVFQTKIGKIGSDDDQFKIPFGIDVDSEGNLYVTDSGNDRIRKFFVDGIEDTVWNAKVSAEGVFKSPRGIITDSQGNIYVSNVYGHNIQKFSSDGSLEKKWGSWGSENNQFKRPWGLAIDSDDNLYVADSGNNRIVKYDNNGSNAEVIISSMSEPLGVDLDSNGNIYVVNWGTIQKFSKEGDPIVTFGIPEETYDGINLIYPKDVEHDSQGNIYVLNENHIHKFDSYGRFIDKWFSTDSESGIAIYLAIDSFDNIYTTQHPHTIHKFNTDGNYLGKFGGIYGTGDGQFRGIRGIDTDLVGNLYIVDYVNHEVQKFDNNGDFVDRWGSKGSGDGQFNHPIDIAVDPNGNVFVLEYVGHRVQKFTNDGTYVTEFGGFGQGDGKLRYPKGITTDPQGNVFVSDWAHFQFQKFDNNGDFVDRWGSRGTNNEKFNWPTGIDVDSNCRVLIVDQANHRIQVYSSRVESCNSTSPIADGGNDQSVQIGDVVQLDGSASYDPDGDIISSFTWSLISLPSGSDTILSDTTLINPTFVADIAGEYIIELVVSDGTNNSAPDEITITAKPITNATYLYVLNILSDIISIYDGTTGDAVDIGKGAGIFVDFQNEFLQTNGNQKYSEPAGMVITRDNKALVSTGENKIIMLDALTGSFLEEFATFGLSDPRGLEIASDDRHLYVANRGGNNIVVYDLMKEEEPKFLEGNLRSPDDVEFDLDGTLYVTTSTPNGEAELLRYDIESNSFESVAQFLPLNQNLRNNNGLGDIELGPERENFFIGTIDINRILRYDIQNNSNHLSEFINKGARWGSAGLGLGPDGNLYLPSWVKGIIDKHKIHENTSEFFINDIGNAELLERDDRTACINDPNNCVSGTIGLLFHKFS